MKLSGIQTGSQHSAHSDLGDGIPLPGVSQHKNKPFASLACKYSLLAVPGLYITDRVCQSEKFRARFWMQGLGNFKALL